MKQPYLRKLQQLPQFRASLMTQTPDYNSAIHYQMMSIEELKALAELRNLHNDLELKETGTLSQPYVDLNSA